MATLFLLGAVFLVGLSPQPATCTTNTDACMPTGIQATDVVSSQAAKPGGKVVTVTVAQKLAKLRKRYRVIEMTCDSSGEDRFRAKPPVANP